MTGVTTPIGFVRITGTGRVLTRGFVVDGARKLVSNPYFQHIRIFLADPLSHRGKLVVFPDTLKRAGYVLKVWSLLTTTRHRIVDDKPRIRSTTVAIYLHQLT